MSRSAAEALDRAYQAYFRVGREVIEGPRCRAVRHEAAPLIYDANHLQVDQGADPASVLALFEEVLGDRDYRQVVAGAFADATLEARLVLEDYVPDATWQGLLDGPLLGPGPVACEIRAVETSHDWVQLDRLVRADHEEVDAKRKTEVYSQDVTDQIQLVRRDCADEIHFFLAWDEDEPVVFFSSWPGIDGVGMVEDLFTLPSHRGRGYARALIHHCVSDARARGADRVLIGALPDDTPKRIYAAMGFRPTCLTWNWLKRRLADSGAG